MTLKCLLVMTSSRAIKGPSVRIVTNFASVMTQVQGSV